MAYCSLVLVIFSKLNSSSEQSCLEENVEILMNFFLIVVRVKLHSLCSILIENISRQNNKFHTVYVFNLSSKLVVYN